MSIPVTAWSPLRHRVFLSLWIAGLVANGALWMQNVGAAWLMTGLATSPLMVALVQTATTLPAFLFNLPGGVLADQIDRRYWLLFTQSWMLICAGLLCVLTNNEMIGPWSLLALTFALGIGNALNLSAWSATVADIVPREEVPAAVALNGVSYNLARVVGPAAAGAVIGWMGAGTVFSIVSACFLSVVVILFFWQGVPPKQQSLPPERLIRGMRNGLNYARHSRQARLVLLRTVIFGTAASSLWALLPLIAKDLLYLEADGYGLLLGSLGAGAVVCAFLLPRLRRALSLATLVTTSSLGFAVCILATAWLDTAWAVYAVLGFGGLCWMAGNSTTAAVLQTNLPAWARARVVAIYLLAFQGSMALGGAFWGAVAEYLGVAQALVISALTLAISTLLIWRQPLQLGSDADAMLSSSPLFSLGAPDVEHAAGPVAVQLDYWIDPAHRDDFLKTMHALGIARRRNGARGWQLYRDLSVEHLYSERFDVDSWLDYLRQLSRSTLADQALEDRVRSYLRPGAAVQQRHYLTELLPRRLDRADASYFSPTDAL